MKYKIKSAEETINLAKTIIKDLKGGQTVALCGDLGSGKTTFCQGLGLALGIKEKINSPTFTYMKIYDVYGHKSIKTLCHIDAYRTENKDFLARIGALDYVGAPGVLTLVEWPEKTNLSFDCKLNFRVTDFGREIDIEN